MTKETEKILLKAVGVVAGYFIIVRPIMQKFGLIKNPADNTSITNPIYNPQTPNSGYTYTLTPTDYESIAHDCYTAFWFLGFGGFESILAGIKKCQTKGDVNKVALTFQNNYGIDFYTYLQKGGGLIPWDGLSTDELSQINTYVNSLPS